MKNSHQKLKLAYISPMPPQKSGIAIYSNTLIPYLSNYYNIDVITQKDISKFKQNYYLYDRVLYHFGNSPFHKYMVKLIQEIPGVVVLHDFYLGDLIFQSNQLTQNTIYIQHGFKAALDYEKLSLPNIIQKYPLNKTILNNSIGIITHSNYAKELAIKFYSKIDNYSIVPLLTKQNKKNLKNKLSIPKNAFVVSSFGIISKNKMALQILKAWKNSSLYHNPNCYLIFVGEAVDFKYLKKLKKIANSNRVIITNWVDDNTYNAYLSITNIAIQLRTNSRGETSATLLECMAQGIPTITNANGANKEFPKYTLSILPDNFKIKKLTLLLEMLFINKNKRASISFRAKKYIKQNHSPNNISKLYYKAIETSYQNISIQNKIDSIYKKSKNLKQAIETIDILSPDKYTTKQILVDISSIVRHDLKTGIQRVVRSQIVELIKNSPNNCRIEPIYFVEDEQYSNYFYAREYTSKLLNLKNFTLSDEPITVTKDDIFYGLDLVPEIPKITQSKIFDKYKNIGVKILFMVYDILPITYPEFFPPLSKEVHTKWLNSISKISDAIITISDKVAKEVKQNINSQAPIFSIHLGANLPNIQISQKKFQKDSKITFIMVGTIEPRKGHKEVLEAFEKLWKDNFDINLKIIGKKGWMVDDFLKKLQNHPKLNKNLFYLEAINDKTLTKLYQSADAIIIASIDEGFGLPLIEAAFYKTPIIARDIKVFKEVASNHAYYFKDNLEIAIKNWIKLYKQNQHPKSNTMPYLTWEQNAKKTLNILLSI